MDELTIVKEEAQKIMAEIETAKKESGENKTKVLELENKLAEQNAVIEGLQKSIKQISTKKEDKNLTFEDAFETIKSEITNLENYRNRKVVAMKATTTTASIADNDVFNRYIREIAPIPSAIPVLTNVLPVMDMAGDGNTYFYVDWDASTSAKAAAAIAEGDPFPEGTAAWEGKSIKLEKLGSTMKVSDEMMRFQPLFMQELRRFLSEDVEYKMNIDLYAANGTTPNIMGLYTRVSAFNHGAYAGVKAKDANLVDLIRILKKQIESTRDRNYMVDTVFVNHEEFLGLQLVKDVNGIPIYDLVVRNLGINIVSSSYVTANTLIIGDSRKARVLRGSDYIIELGYGDEDFEKDLYTLKAKRYANMLIREVEKTAFLKVTDVAAALLAVKL
jgi:hypothetical protein